MEKKEITEITDTSLFAEYYYANSGLNFQEIAMNNLAE